MRKIFEPEREEVAGHWRKSHNEELHDLYLITKYYEVIKSREMTSA
jgi:hypothetical protein